MFQKIEQESKGVNALLKRLCVHPTIKAAGGGPMAQTGSQFIAFSLPPFVSLAVSLGMEIRVRYATAKISPATTSLVSAMP